WVYDGRTGDRISGPLPDQLAVGISRDGVLVAAGRSGKLTEYDPASLRPLGEYPGSRGTVAELQFSRDGTVLFGISYDQTVSVYDVATRSRVGDPIRGDAPNPGILVASARPDGRAVAVTGSSGVQIWDLDPDHLAD